MIPIPNNKGWKVINNYKEVDTIPVNGGFIGVPIEEGSNHIELYFMSYGFKIGVSGSIVGILMTILVMVCYKKTK